MAKKVVKICDKCGKSPAFASYLYAFDGRRKHNYSKLGDLCDDCFSEIVDFATLQRKATL